MLKNNIKLLKKAPEEQFHKALKANNKNCSKHFQGK